MTPILLRLIIADDVRAQYQHTAAVLSYQQAIPPKADGSYAFAATATFHLSRFVCKYGEAAFTSLCVPPEAAWEIQWKWLGMESML